MPNYRDAAQLAVTEALRAKGLFPGTRHLFAALVEEVGELGKALMDHDEGQDTVAHVTEEAVQVAAMALRIIEEGDDSFSYRGRPS